MPQPAIDLLEWCKQIHETIDSSVKMTPEQFATSPTARELPPIIVTQDQYNELFKLRDVLDTIIGLHCEQCITLGEPLPDEFFSVDLELPVLLLDDDDDRISLN